MTILPTYSVTLHDTVIEILFVLLSEAVAVPGGHYRPGSALKDIPMLFSNVSCGGSEGNFMDCSNTGTERIWAISCGSSSHAAGAICSRE